LYRLDLKIVKREFEQGLFSGKEERDKTEARLEISGRVLL